MHHLRHRNSAHISNQTKEDQERQSERNMRESEQNAKKDEKEVLFECNICLDMASEPVVTMWYCS